MYFNNRVSVISHLTYRKKLFKVLLPPLISKDN